MTRQGKSATSTASRRTRNQMSILHMWNSNKGACQSEGNGNIESKEVIPSKACQSLLEENTPKKCGSQTEVQVTSPGRRPVSPQVDDNVSQEVPSETLLLQSGTNVPSEGKDTEDIEERKTNPSSRMFPIFGKNDALKTNNIAPEHPGRNAKSRKLPSNKHLRISKAHQIKRTASAPSNAPLTLIHDDVFAGPSSQSLLSPPKRPPVSPQAIEIVDNSPSIPVMLNADGGSRDEPIVVDSSPVKSPEQTHNPSTTGFFAPRKSNLGKLLSLKHTLKSVGEGFLAHWPNNETQHVRGEQQTFYSCPFDLPYSRAKLSKSVSPTASSFMRGNNCVVEPVGAQADGHAMREGVLRSNATCPATSRFLSADYDISGSSWNERWRPRSAAEVLGNATSAQYLRDWLLALEIKHYGALISTADPGESASSARSTVDSNKYTARGAKRTNIIRAVDKPRKRRRVVDSDEESLGDWIADEEEEDEDVIPPDWFVGEAEGVSQENNEGGSPWKPKLTRLNRRRPPDSNSSEAWINDEDRAPIHDFSDRLTNTILLSGPPGAGKSAAIYACAEELGWEVFEVYPGIGKRNGASLVSLVGDVGRNHIMGKTSWSVPNYPEKKILGNSTAEMSKGNGNLRGGKRKAKQPVFDSFFSVGTSGPFNTTVRDCRKSFPSVGERSPSHVQIPADARADFSLLDCYDRTSTPVKESDKRHTSAQQSIILLEEVDILFSEDVNFWPTVITFIKESRRPVIMTCNDPRLIPCADLPLQTVLTFNPSSSDLATSYLQSLALTEGYATTKDHLKTIYENSPIDTVYPSAELMRASARQSFPAPDLRRAINSLQFLCLGDPGLQDATLADATTLGQESSFPDDIHDLDAFASHDLWDWDWSRNFISEAQTLLNKETEYVKQKDASDVHRLWRFSDILSMIDSDLSRRPSAALEMYALERGSSSDEELGYRHLAHDSEMLHLQGGIALYNYDNPIAAEATFCIRNALEGHAPRFESERTTHPRTEETKAVDLLGDQKRYLARVSGILERIAPAASTESIGTLMLDYLPWVHVIDRADGLQEAAVLRDNEARTGVRGGRMTRNSQRVEYERYFKLDEEERMILNESELRVDPRSVEDTLCGVDHEP